VSNALLGNFTQKPRCSQELDKQRDGRYLSRRRETSSLTLSVDGGSAFTVNVAQGVATSKGQNRSRFERRQHVSRQQRPASLKGNQLVLTSKTKRLDIFGGHYYHGSFERQSA